MGFKVKLNEAEKKVSIFEKGTNKLAAEIPLQDDAELRKYSPKSLNRTLVDEMMKVKNGTKAALTHSLKALPSESMIFFVSMGAVVAANLVTDYSQNPVKMKEHIESQISPVGLFGFYTFMASQGVTSSVLTSVSNNPRFHALIPYLGMTVGSFVQSYLTQFISDPNVKACGKQMMGKKVSTEELESEGADADPCTKAYEYFVIQKKIWEFAPGIASMLISSFLSAALVSTVSGVIRITGFDLALMIFPGGFQLKALRLALVKGLGIAAFVGIDSMLNRTVTTTWKNFFDGNDFNGMSERLNSEMNQSKSSQWNSANPELISELKNFKTKMSDWRMMNMSDIFEAHQAWSENIFQLTSMFNSSYSFYNAFVSEVRNVHYNEQIVKPLLMSYPLNGVTPKGLSSDRQDLIFQSPKMVENWQADTVYDVVDQIDQFSKTQEFQNLYANEKARLSKIRSLLNSEDHMTMGEGLDWLNYSIKETQQSVVYSNSYVKALTLIRKNLGQPAPKIEPGRGFLSSFELAPTTAASLKGTPFYRQVGNMQTPHVTEFLLMQMICGPDAEKGEQIVRTSFGFPAVFMPPQLKTDSVKFSQVCDTLGRGKYTPDNIYIWPTKNQTSFAPIDSPSVPQSNRQSQSERRGFLSYLVDNTRMSVMGTENESGFQEWWTESTEPQMQRAFGTFSKSYDEIVVRMIQKMWGNQAEEGVGKSIGSIIEKNQAKLYRQANRGPISNAAMTATFQEERTYLSILQEILNPKGQYALDLKNIIKVVPEQKVLQAVESEFVKIKTLLQRIKAVNKEGRIVVESDLENDQLDAQLVKVQAALTAVANKLGVGDKALGKSSTPQLTESQKEVAALCLKNLESLASEMLMFGKIANAVSWDKIQNTKNVNVDQGKFNNEVQKALAKIRSLISPVKN
jgi:hypothetical protein